LRDFRAAACIADPTTLKARRTSLPRDDAANLASRLAPFTVPTTEPTDLQGFPERMMGLEPTTFCMASRRSSQLSYIRTRPEYSRGFSGLKRVESLVHEPVGELVVLAAHGRVRDRFEPPCHLGRGLPELAQRRFLNLVLAAHLLDD
jgi:hypothetical protein